jgi:xylose isomerase
MDTLAQSLLIADRIIQDGEMDAYLDTRYSGYKEGIGAKILKGEMTLVELENWTVSQGEPEKISARQELRESLFNRYIYSGVVK